MAYYPQTFGFTLNKGWYDQEQKINKIYRHKIIKYGRFTEVHDYFQLRVSFTSKRGRIRRNYAKPKSDYALQRAKSKLFQIIEANNQAHGAFRTIFATLTFKEQTSDRKVADRRVALFIKRLGRHCGYKIKYVFVPERHISGMIHYHGVFFNLPFIPVQYLQEKIYKLGYIDLQAPRKLQNIIYYVSKYITKDVIRSAKKNEKAYLCPRGMIIPSTTLDYFEKDETMEVLMERYLTHKKITKYGQV